MPGNGRRDTREDATPVAVARASGDRDERGGRALPHGDLAGLAGLQTRLNDALRALAAGAVASPLSTWRGFAAARCHPAWTTRLAELEQLRARLAGDAPVDGGGTVADAAAASARGYAFLARATGVDPAAPARVACDAMPWPGRALDRVGPVAGLRAELLAGSAADLRAAYVHGSYSSGDFNAYSDLDTLVVLRAAVATDAARLLDCAARLARSSRWLLRCDLLQHHGHFVLTEIDLDWYCDAHFPAALYPHSTELFADGRPGISRVRDGAAEAQAQLRAMCARFTGTPARVRPGVAFELKLWLSCFMILPSLLLQARGRPCWKRESFELARPLYTAAEFAAMDEVSAMRERWRQSAPGAWARLGALSPVLRGALFVRGGRWGVPAEIARRAGEPGFQAALRDFAVKTLALADAA